MYLNQWFGRRDNILIACAWMILGGILSATAINVGMVTNCPLSVSYNLNSMLVFKYSVGRAFVGIGSGMSGSSVAIYVSEIATKRSRGALGSLFELFLNLGILLTQVCGLYMSYVPVWRVLWAIPTILAAIQLVLIACFTVECPRHLCANGQYDKARAALQRFRPGADIDDEFAQLLQARKREIEEGARRMSILDIVLLKNKRVTWNTIIAMVLQAYNQVGGIGPMSGEITVLRSVAWKITLKLSSHQQYTLSVS